MTIDPHTPDRPAETRSLPPIDDERVDRMEDAVFAGIAADRRTRRARGWAVGGAAAAVIAVAAVIAPSVGGVLAPAGVMTSSDAAVAPATPFSDAGGAAEDTAISKESLSSGADSTVDSTAARDIITTASATVVVDDIADAVDALTDAATSRDGYVESMSVGRSGVVMPIDPMMGGTTDTSMPYPTPAADAAWVTLRVPADALDSLVDQLSGLGDVTASSVNRQDVTEVTVDLQARVDAAQASVDRMTELLAGATNLTDLIAAESALAERQATLESYQQQLKYYDEQVAMSTLTVTLTEPAQSVAADPAGFGDGLAAGWNGLVATLNGIVIALGFLLPWLAVAGVVALIVWGVVTLVRRRRRKA